MILLPLSGAFSPAHSTLIHRDSKRSVWLSRQSDRGRWTVTKTPVNHSPASAEEFRTLAIRELSLSSTCPRDSAVRVLRCSLGLRPWLQTEWAGIRWDIALKSLGMLRRLGLLAVLAESLSCVHRAGIIHGDLKPANVYVSSGGPAGRSPSVRLSDFAYGRHANERDKERAGLGTVGYMAPEIILGGGSSFQSDLFSFGVIAWETLNGRHPFILGPVDDPLHICSRTIEDSPPADSHTSAGCLPALAALLTSLLAKHSEDRPSSAAAVAACLRKQASTYSDRLHHPAQSVELESTDLLFRPHQQ